MAILIFFLYVVMFFVISTLMQWLYHKLVKTLHFDLRWIAPLLAVLTIIIWMTIPGHWLVLIFFAITVGTVAGQKEENTKKHNLF